MAIRLAAACVNDAAAESGEPVRASQEFDPQDRGYAFDPQPCSVDDGKA